MAALLMGVGKAIDAVPGMKTAMDIASRDDFQKLASNKNVQQLAKRGFKGATNYVNNGNLSKDLKRSKKKLSKLTKNIGKNGINIGSNVNVNFDTGNIPGMENMPGMENIKGLDEVSNILNDNEILEKAKSMSSLDEIFDLVGLFEHPKAQEIKEAVMSILESLSIINDFDPPDQTLGEYLCECTTCKQTKNTFEKEAKNIIKKHYKLKRTDYEQAFKLQLQQYVDDNDATYNCDLEEMKEQEEKEEKENEEKKKKKQDEEKIKPPKNISSVYPLFP